MFADHALQALERSLGKKVMLRLKEGGGIRGTLLGFDAHMNLLLDEAEEVFKENGKKLGLIIVRGDNIILVSPSE
jgi:small nuclear ribonucleoprotein